MQKLVLLALSLILLGCSDVNYRSGRDTVKSFKDGRFQVLRTSGNTKILYDLQQQKILANDVAEWKVVAGHLCTFDRREKVFVVLDLESGLFNKYKHSDLAPVEFRPTLKNVANSRLDIGVYLRVPRDIELCFDSLLAWQSGDTNQFHRIINEKEYDSNLRDAVRRAIRQGKEGEVLRFINLVLDHWMITESCHSRSYEWPDREADQAAWEFLSRIYVNRQQHPYSTGDADGDATLNRILEKTR